MEKVSLVLPTRNAEWCLPYSLKSVNELSPPPDEILVCVGNSSDNTEKMILNFQKESKVPVKIFYDKEGLGTGYAMNVLTENAKNEQVVWIDSDFILPPNWIEMVVRLFKEYDLSWMGCVSIEIDPKNISTAKAPPVPLENIWFVPKHNHTGGMMAFKRPDILKMGNFDPLFPRGQDLDMTMRCIANGLKGGVCKGEIHAGLFGEVNFKKVIDREIFWNLFYKYGWRICVLNTHLFSAFLLRMTFILTSILGGVSILVGHPSIPIIALWGMSLLGLVGGIVITYKRFNFDLLTLQLVGSVGEIYQFFNIFFFRKDRPAFGYGEKFLIEKFKTQKDYWDRRYRRGGNSGLVRPSRQWKHDTINGIIGHTPEHVIDYGCGDLVFWENIDCADYTGIDVSPYQVSRDKELRPDWKFFLLPNIASVKPAPVVLCMDVLYHIIPEDDFIQTLENLTELSTDYIFIYTLIHNFFKDRDTDNKYQKFRVFSQYYTFFNDRGFKLTHVVEAPSNKFNALYVFRRENK